MTRYNGSESSSPPRKLGRAGNDLWQRINMDFVLADETEREMLLKFVRPPTKFQILLRKSISVPSLMGERIAGTRPCASLGLSS
jgi:hypothetical protein